MDRLLYISFSNIINVSRPVVEGRTDCTTQMMKYRNIRCIAAEREAENGEFMYSCVWSKPNIPIWSSHFNEVIDLANERCNEVAPGGRVVDRRTFGRGDRGSKLRFEIWAIYLI